MLHIDSGDFHKFGCESQGDPDSMSALAALIASTDLMRDSPEISASVSMPNVFSRTAIHAGSCATRRAWRGHIMAPKDIILEINKL